ncbi:MAG: PDZ domain-containing protein [Planctomycetota bacterium]
MKRAAALCLLLAAPAAAQDLEPKLRGALVRLQATSQGYDAREPWKTSGISNRGGRGVVIAPGTVLTLAANVRDHRMITLSVANSSRQYEARLKHVDYRVGLAQVEILDEELKARMSPLEIGDPVRLDDEFDVYQLGQDNMVERSTARVVRADAGTSRLSLRLKTTLSDGGNGQVALRDGKIAGLISATNARRQEGTLLSVETIRRYLDDFADGKYDGLPGGGIWWQPLLRDDLRAFHGLGDDRHGIAVTRVVPGRTGDGVLRAGDVITEVDGYALDDEGKFTHETHGRLSAAYLFQGRRYAGGTIPVKVLRDGKELELEVTLKAWPRPEQRVPQKAVDRRPRFLVVGGLVILELDRSSASGVVLRRYRARSSWDPPGERRRIVFVDHVLDDPTNKGFESLNRALIETVNGRPINEIKDVAAALEQPQGRFHVLRFEGVNSDFVIEASKLAEIDRRVAKTYGVTLLRHLD